MAQQITSLNTFIDGNTIYASEHNENFTEVQTKFNTHSAATTGEHGVDGTFVGTTDIQTLTNKTLTSAILDTPTLNDATGTILSADLTTCDLLNCVVDSGGAVVGTSNTQTLTNKTLTNPTISSATFSGSNFTGMMDFVASGSANGIRDAYLRNTRISISNAGTPFAAYLDRVVAKTWASIDVSSIATDRHINIDSVIKNGTGDYSVRIDKNLDNSVYAVTCGCIGAWSTAFCNVAARTTSLVRFCIYGIYEYCTPVDRDFCFSIFDS